MKVTVQLEFEVDGVYIPGVPAYISGPPEVCDTGEASEFDMHEVTLNGKPLSDSAFHCLAEALIDAAIAEVERNHLDALDPTITP